MLKFFHALHWRRKTIELNKSRDSLASETEVKGRKSKKKPKKGKKKNTKRDHEPSRGTELTGEELASPTINISPSSDCPDSKPEPRKSFENIFKYSGRRRASSKFAPIFNDDFWDRHFSGQRSAPWEDFRAAFLADYGALINNFAPERTHWILAIVHEDIFRDLDNVYWCHYDKFCKQYEDGDRLWLSIRKYASERIFREGVVESMFE